jgi:hypothetical protein
MCDRHHTQFIAEGGAGVNQFRAGKETNSGALPLSHIRCPFATSMARQYPKTDIAEVEGRGRSWHKGDIPPSSKVLRLIVKSLVPGAR